MNPHDYWTRPYPGISFRHPRALACVLSILIAVYVLVAIWVSGGMTSHHATHTPATSAVMVGGYSQECFNGVCYWVDNSGRLTPVRGQ